MTWEKVPAENIALLDQMMSEYPDAMRKSMFGCPVYFIAGNLCIGAHEGNFMVRLSDADRAELLEHPAVINFTPMPGRPMREYLLLPPVIHQNSDLFRSWIRRAVDYVRTLPSPPPKKSRIKRIS